MNLQEQISRMKSMMGVINEVKQKVYETKPIILIGPQGGGKSTTAKVLAKKLGIELIQTDMCMIKEKYLNECKKNPKVKVEIKKTSDNQIYYDSNDEYPLCVINKIMEEYGNKKIILDVGATHAYINKDLSNDVKELFETSPNVFIFNVSNDENETYKFLKKRREGRGEKTTSKEIENKIKKAITNLNNYYKGTQKISIINSDKSDKTTEDIVDEIITKLT